jgi:prepilin-type N-terminal cleavage/methylation domain-containing protein
MKKESGFTLIELLLVLAIIGIISAIAIPALLGQRERAKAKAVQANVDNVAGECARINDTTKEAGNPLAATAIVSSVLSLPNYQLANAKNPYDGSRAAYTATAGSTAGDTVMIGSAVADVTGSSYSAVVITGFWKDGATTKSLQKIVALD